MSANSCCRTSISTSPPPTASCATAAWRWASPTIWVARANKISRGAGAALDGPGLTKAGRQKGPGGDTGPFCFHQALVAIGIVGAAIGIIRHAVIVAVTIIAARDA